MSDLQRGPTALLMSGYTPTLPAVNVAVDHNTSATVYRDINETKLAKVTSKRALLARDLGAQVEAALQAAARSPNSARAYRQGIGLFLQYLDGVWGGGLGLAQPYHEGRATAWAYAGQVNVLRHIEAGNLDGFRAWREAQGDAPNTASQRYAAVVTFLSVAYRDGILTDKQALSMGIRPYRQRQKRDNKPVGRRLTKEEVRALRATFNLDTHKGLRDRALLDLALFAGLRCEELATLDLGAFKQDAGRWWLVFEGKGSKTRKVKLHDTLFESLRAWLTTTGRELGKGEGPVFYSVNKGDAIGQGRVNTGTVNRLVAEYGARAGLAPPNGTNRLAPHDLRRTCARNAYDNGAPLPMIQAMLGHADVSTTMRYIGSDGGDNGGAVDFVRY